jgi:acyl carrier protein
MDERIKKVLCAVFDVAAEEIHDGTAPANVGMWDSLNHLRMVTELEKEFGVRLRQKEIREMVSFSRIRETLGRHIAESAG